jgi:hypothetical protein
MKRWLEVGLQMVCNEASAGIKYELPRYFLFFVMRSEIVWINYRVSLPAFLVCCEHDVVVLLLGVVIKKSGSELHKHSQTPKVLN